MPTRISTRATLSLKRMEMKLASSASPIHTVAIPQPISMTVASSFHEAWLQARACARPVSLRHEGDQVHALRSEPAAVDRHVIAQRARPVRAEEGLVELCRCWSVCSMSYRAASSASQRCSITRRRRACSIRDQADVKRPRVVLQEAATAAADEEHIALGRKLPHELAERLEVPLVQAAGTKALEDPGRLLVDSLQLRQADTQPTRLVLEQLAVEHRQLQPLGQASVPSRSLPLPSRLST